MYAFLVRLSHSNLELYSFAYTVCPRYFVRACDTEQSLCDKMLCSIIQDPVETNYYMRCIAVASIVGDEAAYCIYNAHVAEAV